MLDQFFHQFWLLSQKWGGDSTDQSKLIDWSVKTDQFFRNTDVFEILVKSDQKTEDSSGKDRFSPQLTTYRWCILCTRSYFRGKYKLFWIKTKLNVFKNEERLSKLSFFISAWEAQPSLWNVMLTFQYDVKNFRPHP